VIGFGWILKGLEVLGIRGRPGQATLVPGAAMVAVMWLIAVLMLGWGLLAVGKSMGRAEGKATCAVAKVATVATAHQDYVRDIQDGHAKVAELESQLTTLRDQRETLQRKLAHVPRVVPTPACPDPGGVRLSVGGLLQWNAALGHPGLPADACGADEGPAGACAAAARDSGVSLEQAERNARRNFELASSIRAQCQALIERVRQREAQATQQPFPFDPQE
jgi:hypothetical protein